MSTAQTRPQDSKAYFAHQHPCGLKSALLCPRGDHAKHILTSKRFIRCFGVAAVTLAATTLGCWLVTHPRSPSQPTATSLAHADDQEPRALPSTQAGAPPQLPSEFQSANGTAPAALANLRTEPTPEARRLVATLVGLDTSGGVVAREAAELWKEGLQGLIQQGAGAVPAIREFLERNLEHDYAGIPGAHLLGHASLRIALIEALQQIGGAEALAVVAQTLQTTTVPTEIALLARYVEQQAPGEFKQEILTATRDVLDMASKGQLADWDMGPLFRVLQDYGDATSALELQQRLPQWRYYATISLAGLQDGQGIPMLIQQLRDPAATSRSTTEFAFQMLAQASARYPEAAAALIEQANQIPDAAWRKIASGLAGDQYQLSQAGLNRGRPSGMQTFHVVSGNQNFHCIPFTSAATLAEIEKRQALIAQLLSATSSPAAVEALQGAEGLLASLGTAP